ncbi:hypothetical protein ACEZCY_31685 [Streptacidiphilus sp. N1-12]|uniref:HEAT repeat domain-containing protein n=2 Tax=Streptacidiphilus alkalitolerans TaxID=3342712 RepID=A0ABV6VJ55_9ACTN
MPLPSEVDLGTLYGASAADSGFPPGPLGDFGEGDGEEADDLPLVPPVRLLEREELAAAALRVPLFERAIRLARWVGPRRPVDEWGELDPGLQARAAIDLGFGEGEEGVDAVVRAWVLAVDLELIAVGDSAEDGGGEVAAVTDGVEALEQGDPETVLTAWESAASIVAGITVEAELDLGDLAEGADTEAVAGSGEEETEEEYAQLEEAREQAEGLLDEALQVLYEARAFATTESEETVPLGVLSALLVVPDGEDPTEEMLGDITSVMVALDPMLQDLADIGILDYRPIDPSLFDESEDGSGAPELPTEPFDPDAPVEETEAARFGLARLTALGVHQVRQWLIEDGYDAPLIGDHARGTAAELLAGIAGSANVMPEEEIAEWLVGREPLAAAAELLAASRGNDLVGPIRRQFCALALGRLGEEVEPSVREALGDPHLTVLATAWLVEQGATDVVDPGRPVLLWSTVDQLAALLIDLGPEDETFLESVLQLVGTSAAEQYFAELWRVEHPYTTAVLEAIGEQHPDRATAKEARKAAYKARSRAGTQAK